VSTFPGYGFAYPELRWLSFLIPMGRFATSYNSSEYPYGLMPPWMSFEFPTMGGLCFSVSHYLHSERLNIMVLVPHGARQHVLKPGSDPKVVGMPPDWYDSELMESLGTEDRGLSKVIGKANPGNVGLLLSIIDVHWQAETYDLAHDHQMPVFTSDANSFPSHAHNNRHLWEVLTAQSKRSIR
jgi:hypothetical protein